MKLSSTKKKCRKYDDSSKALALSLYHISGEAYRFIAKFFHLPSKKTLTSLVSKFASNCGFTEKSLFVLKQGVEQLPPGGRFCTQIMDEVSLKSHLFNDQNNDSISGLRILVM